MPVGSYYGYATGVVGLRLFRILISTKAAAKWDGALLHRPELLQRQEAGAPYRVGMSCGFCHVGPNPSNPPRTRSIPKWENLNSNPGAQYFWVDRIFVWNVDIGFPYQLFHLAAGCAGHLLHLHRLHQQPAP